MHLPHAAGECEIHHRHARGAPGSELGMMVYPTLLPSVHDMPIRHGPFHQTPMPRTISSITFAAEDGFPLRGTLYAGTPDDGPVVLISSAAAVRRDHYGAFAEALVAAGATAVLTYDYRGVGQSVVPPDWERRIDMKDWGAQDMAAAASLLARLFPGRELVGVGQSIGGTLIGLCPKHDLFRRYALVASGNGWLGHTDEALKLFLSMNILALPVTWLTGRAPGWLGIGETLPGSVFRDWARWCRRRGFLFEDPGAARGFETLETPLLFIGATDDPWSTARATSAMQRYIPNAPREERWFSPAEVGATRIGHLGFFKEKFTTTLWPTAVDWLVKGKLAPMA